MKCPIDNIDLVMSERSGIEIDYCPTCRGVWLDRGELDKIIERSEQVVTPSRPVATQPEPPHPQRQEYRDQPKYDKYGHNDHHKKKKRESFLGDIFDF